MISESIYTERPLEKDLGQPRWPEPEAGKRGVRPGFTLFTENTKQNGNDYHKEPFALDLIIKRCNFLMKLDKPFKENCIYKTWVIIGQADRDTNSAEI